MEEKLFTDFDRARVIANIHALSEKPQCYLNTLRLPPEEWIPTKYSLTVPLYPHILHLPILPEQQPTVTVSHP